MAYAGYGKRERAEKLYDIEKSAVYQLIVHRQRLTTFTGLPSAKARRLSIAVLTRRVRASRVAQAMWGVM